MGIKRKIKHAMKKHEARKAVMKEWDNWLHSKGKWGIKLYSKVTIYVK